MSDDSRLLSALLASPQLALVEVVDGTISRWSQGAVAALGWSPSEAVGQPLELLSPSPPLDELISGPRAASDGQQPSVQVDVRSRAGHHVPARVQLLAPPDEQDRPSGFLLLCGIGIAPGSAAAAADDELEARFERSPVPQARVSVDGRVLAVNDAITALLGVDAAGLVGTDGLLLVHEDDRGDVTDVLARVAAGELTDARIEARVLTAAGDVRQTVLTGSVFHQDDAEPLIAVSALDLTDLRAVEQVARVQADLLDAVLTTLPVVVFSFDQRGRCTFSRGRGLDALGLQQDELVGADLFDVYAHVPQAVDGLRRTLNGEEFTVTMELQGRTLTSGSRPQYDAAGTLVGGFGICIDVTERTEAERKVQVNEAWLNSLLQHASDVALVADSAGGIVYASPAARLQLGHAAEDLIGTEASALAHPDDRPLIIGAWSAVTRAPAATASCECRVRHADGSWVWTEQMFTNLLEDPVIGGVVINVRETTQRRQVEEDLRRLALQDALTGLANRTILLDRVRQALTWERRGELRTALIVLDVVGMQVINQDVGQERGDRVLREIAHRLQAAVPPGDSLARVGGDEFAVLVAGVVSAEEVRARLATLLEVADDPVLVAGRSLQVGLRGAFAVSPTADAGLLLAEAERAVRLAASGSAHPEPREHEQVAELRAALAAQQLTLHYQPVIDVASGGTAGAEALVRWQHPTRGLLAPSEFIPLAERSGLVLDLGEWVLRAACTRLAAWQAEGREWRIGVNLSPRQLVGTDFPALVRVVLCETGARADRLVIEVTESAVMDDPAAPEVLTALRAMGVRLALDDFGTGYSSMTYLRRFPVDAIKIDRSFVSGLGRDADDDAIVASIVSLARAVGKLVVAEGVETRDQLQALAALGVDQAQGFLWSRPVPTDQLEVWARDRPQLTARATSAAPARSGPGPQVAPADLDEARILELHQQGASLHTIAAALNREGRRTASGPRWTTTTVARAVTALAGGPGVARPSGSDQGPTSG